MIFSCAKRFSSSFRLLGLFVLSSLMCEQLLAQSDPFENPFGTPTAPSGGLGMGANDLLGGASAGANNQPISEEDPDPVIRLLRKRPPKTTDQYADAFTWVTRLKRWDEAQRLLDRLAAANFTLEQQAELARNAGPAIWLRLRNKDAGLTDSQRQLVNSVLNAPGRAARDPNTLNSWIAKLNAPQIQVRELAVLRLQDAGSTGIKALTDRLLAKSDPIPDKRLVETLIACGRDGIEALQAASVAKDPQQAAQVLLAISQTQSVQFTPELLGGLYHQSLDADTKEQLAAAISTKFGSAPSEDAARSVLSEQFKLALGAYQARRSANGLKDRLWRISDDSMSIEPVEATIAERELERLAQLATLTLNSTLANPTSTIEAATALLQHVYQQNTRLQPGDTDSLLMTKAELMAGRDQAFWQAVVKQANEWQFHGAVVRGIQRSIAGARAAQYLPPLSFLSDQLYDARPIVRYTALEAIHQLDPQQNYRGSEQAIRVALEMTKLAAGPQAIVIGLQSELRQAAVDQLRVLTTSDIIAVNSSRKALQELSGDQPVELIVIVDRVADQSIYELLQRLRKTSHGKSLPIAVLTDRLYQHERELISNMPGVFSATLSRNTEQMQRVLQRMLESLDTATFTNEERSSFAVVAGKFLAKLSSDRDRYRFYPLGNYQQQLLSTDATELGTRIDLLAGIGTAAAQRELMNFTGSTALDANTRQAAANAFGKSVRRHGTRLQRGDIVAVYDRYNELGPNDPVAVKTMGLVLDVIEAQAGKAEWPEGF